MGMTQHGLSLEKVLKKIGKNLTYKKLGEVLAERTSIQISKGTLERLKECRTWKNEDIDVLLNMLIDSHSKSELSPCQICHKMCYMQIAKIPMIEEDGRLEWVMWSHLEEQGHPPYPAAENSKAEALADFKKWEKEMAMINKRARTKQTAKL